MIDNDENGSLRRLVTFKKIKKIPGKSGAESKEDCTESKGDCAESKGDCAESKEDCAESKG